MHPVPDPSCTLSRQMELLAHFFQHFFWFYSNAGQLQPHQKDLIVERLTALFLLCNAVFHILNKYDMIYLSYDILYNIIYFFMIQFHHHWSSFTRLARNKHKKHLQ